MNHINQTTVEQLTPDDIFFHNGQKYTLIENNSISTSFNELIVLNDSVQQNLKLKKTDVVTVNETFTPNQNLQTLTEHKSSVRKVRNERGNLISVDLYDPEALIERKLTKDEIKKRDQCADELLSNPKFQERYGDPDNIRPPGKTIDDVAYGICTNRATGRETTKRRKTQKESYEVKRLDRINTLRNAIRRIPNEEF